MSFKTHTSAVNSLITTSLGSYTTTTDMNTALAAKVDSTFLTANYTNTTDLTTALAAKADTSALADYVLTTDLTTTLGDYVLTTALTTTLGGYYTKGEVDSAIAAIPTGDPSVGAVASVSTATTLTSANYIVAVDTSTTALTITLDAAPATGKMVVIKDDSGNASTHNITIAGNGKNIDGASSATIAVDSESVTLAYNGTQWNVI